MSCGGADGPVAARRIQGRSGAEGPVAFRSENFPWLQMRLSSTPQPVPGISSTTMNGWRSRFAVFAAFQASLVAALILSNSSTDRPSACGAGLPAVDQPFGLSPPRRTRSRSAAISSA